MPDSLLAMRFLDAVQPRTRRSEAEETQIAADHTQIAATEAHDVATTLDLGEAHQLARQRLADVNTSSPRHLMVPGGRTRRRGSRGSSVPQTPELADGWMVGTSPTMTTWVPTVGI